VLDGQFENYTTWLADEWVKFRKLNATHGNEVGYHVLLNTTPSRLLKRDETRDP
jgi:hypothetical protein